MANAKGKVEIRIAATGEDEARKSLGRVRIAVTNLRSVMSRVGDSGSAGLVGFAKVVGGILASVGKLAAKMGALAITGGATAGLAAFKSGIDKVRTIAQETVDRVNELSAVAKTVGFGKFGEDAARQLAIFELAAKNVVSTFDVDALKTITVELSSLRNELLAGDEGAHEKAAKFGLRVGDLWTDGDLRRPREAVDLFNGLADAISRLPRDMRIPAIKELIGEEEATKLAPIFEDMPKLREELEQMSKLVVFPPGFEKRVQEIAAAQRELEAASLSAKVALTNGYAPAMIAGATGLRDLLVEIRPVIERMGAAVGSFIADVSTRVRDMISRMAKDVDASGASMLENGLSKALTFMRDLIVSLIARAEELFAYFANGEIKAPWVQTLVDGLTSLKSIIAQLVEMLPTLETVVAGVGKAAGALQSIRDVAGKYEGAMSQLRGAGASFGDATGLSGFAPWIEGKLGINSGLTSASRLASAVPTPASVASAPSRAVRVDLYAGNEKLLETTAAEGEIERLQRGQRAAARARN